MYVLKVFISQLGMCSILYRKSKKVYKCQLLQYKTKKLNLTNSHLAHFTDFGYYSSQSCYGAFYSSSHIIERSIEKLSKRSASVDQNLGSESMHSQLFVAILQLPVKPGDSGRSYIIKRCQNAKSINTPPLVTFWRDIRSENFLLSSR